MPRTQNTFTIYEDEFYGQLNETLVQNTEVFNAASGNAIVLETDPTVGNFQKEAFFQSIGEDLINRRDIGSTAGITPDDLTSDEMVRPKLARKYFVAKAMSALKRIGFTEGEFSLALGEQVAKAMMVDYLNTAILCGVTAMEEETDIVLDAEAGTIENTTLVNGLATFGDSSTNVVGLVFHSKPFFDLMGEQVQNITDRIAGATIYEGTVGTLGLPAIVTDSPQLVDAAAGAGGEDIYRTIGLTTNALQIIQDGQPSVVDEMHTGQENIEYRVQGEHDYNVGVKGYSYTDNAANPDDAALATGANWSSVMADLKSTAGFLIRTQ